MVMSRDLNAGRGHNIKIDTRSFERVKQFSYLGTALTDQNSMKEKIKSRWKEECMLPFGVRIFCLPVCYQNYKDYEIQNYAKRDKIIQEWIKLHPKELHELYPSTIIIRGFKSRRMIWAGYVARIGDRREAYKVLVGKAITLKTQE